MYPQYQYQAADLKWSKDESDNNCEFNRQHF